MATRRIGVFHPGTQHSWQTALAFQESGTLSWYATSVFYDPAKWPYRIERFLPSMLRARASRDFKRRYSPLLDPKHVRQFGAWEWFETFARRAGMTRSAGWLNLRGNEAYCKAMIELMKVEPVDTVWGYNSSSLELFKWAKPRGIVCILDQTIGHAAAESKVMQREFERHPEFFRTHYQPFSSEWIDRQNEELDLADYIVVGSDFCRTTLEECGCPSDKIRVVPYGYDATIFDTQGELPNHSGKPRLLFVGQVTPRKGIAYLLKASSALLDHGYQLTIVGGLDIPRSTFDQYRQSISYVPSVPRSELPLFFEQADIFVFPTLFEGAGIVLFEACAGGLAIVQSTNAWLAISNGANGRYLDQVSVETLVESVTSLCAEPQRLFDMRRASRAASKGWSWSRYRQNIRQLISEL
jgi:glycosyltransferase involved in cell wall biosynthesis